MDLVPLEINMKYPSRENVLLADRVQIARWWRFLPSPGVNYLGQEDFLEMAQYEAETMNIINARFEEFGGMNHELSKVIGWKKIN